MFILLVFLTAVGVFIAVFFLAIWMVKHGWKALVFSIFIGMGSGLIALAELTRRYPADIPLDRGYVIYGVVACIFCALTVFVEDSIPDRWR